MVNVKLFRFVAWTGLVLVAIATLSPIGLRPESIVFTPSIERFGAFSVIGLAFALAYPRQFWLTVFVAIGSAVLLEVLQLVVPSRHAQLFDMLVKVAGSATGLVLGQLLQRYRFGS